MIFISNLVFFTKVSSYPAYNCGFVVMTLGSVVSDNALTGLPVLKRDYVILYVDNLYAIFVLVGCLVNLNSWFTPSFLVSSELTLVFVKGNDSYSLKSCMSDSTVSIAVDLRAVRRMSTLSSSDKVVKGKIRHSVLNLMHLTIAVTMCVSKVDIFGCYTNLREQNTSKKLV